jgi:hypothetical protein
VNTTAIKHHYQQPFVVPTVSCRSTGTMGLCIIHDRHACVAFVVAQLILHIAAAILLLLLQLACVAAGLQLLLHASALALASSH